MAWSAPGYTGGVVWEDAPSTLTPLNAADLNTEESAEATYAAQVGQSVVNYFEGGSSPALLLAGNDLSDIPDVDAARANLKVPALRHAQCVATTNQSLSGALPTIDGYVVQDGDRVLLVGQTTASQNGMWLAHTAGWVRPNDYPNGAILTSRSCKVTGGVVYRATDWVLANTASITVGSSAATWMQVQPPPNVVTSSRTGGLKAVPGLVTAINILDYGADNTGVTASDSARDLALADARQLRLPLLIPPGNYKWTTPLLVMGGDVYWTPGGWNMTTITFAFSAPGPAIDVLDPTDPCYGVHWEGGVRLFGDSVNTTEGVFARSALRWNMPSLRIDRGFTRHGFYEFGQRWKAGTNSSAGLASSQGPGGVLTAPVLVGDNTISLSATADYQESGFVKLLTPKSTIRVTTLSEVFTIPVVDASQFTQSGAIQVAGSGETIFYTGRDLVANNLTGAIRRIDSRLNHSLAAGQTVYQAEIAFYSGKDDVNKKLVGVLRGQRMTTAIAHGSDVAAPTGLVGAAAAGGTLAGTQIYRVTALNGALESIASNEVSVALSGGNGTVNLTWNPVAGATQYRVSRAAASGNAIDQSTSFITYTSGWLVAATGTAFTDDGSVAPTIMGAPFGAYQNPGSSSRNVFDDLHSRSGAIAPIRWGGTIGADTSKVTTLTGPVAAGDGTINVTDATQLASNAADNPSVGGWALIVSTAANVTTAEIVYWATKTATQLQGVVRAQWGTSAAAHATGDFIYLLRRQWGGNSNQAEHDTVFAEPDTNAPFAGMWLDQCAAITLNNPNSSGQASSGASAAVGGHDYSFGGYACSINGPVTGAVGANGYMFHHPDGGNLIRDNYIRTHDVEGSGHYGQGVLYDPAHRCNYQGYRAGVKLARTDPFGADAQWKLSEAFIFDPNGNPGAIDPNGLWVPLSGLAQQLPNLVAPANPILGNGSTAPGTNVICASRVIVPKSGTLHDLAIYIGTSSGNLRLGVYDTGDTNAGSRTLLFDSGSVASPGTGWHVIADPALSVKAGQELDFVLIADNATLAPVRFTPFSAAYNQLPANFWPVSGGASPKLAWTNSPGAFSFPATILEGNCAAQLVVYMIIARVA